MFTAQQARALKDSLQKQFVEVELYNVLKDIAERSIEPKTNNYVYADVNYVDEKVDYLVNRLKNLGYDVVAERYPEDRYSSLTVRW